MFFIYLLACLAIYVPTTINGRRYLRFGDTFNGKKIEDISVDTMFVACLGLNTRRIYKQRVQLYL